MENLHKLINFWVFFQGVYHYRGQNNSTIADSFLKFPSFSFLFGSKKDIEMVNMTFNAFGMNSGKKEVFAEVNTVLKVTFEP